MTRPGVTEKKQLQRGLQALETKKLVGALVNASHDVRPERLLPAVHIPSPLPWIRRLAQIGPEVISPVFALLYPPRQFNKAMHTLPTDAVHFWL